jgi:hypothetical protein
MIPSKADPDRDRDISLWNPPIKIAAMRVISARITTFKLNMPLVSQIFLTPIAVATPNRKKTHPNADNVLNIIFVI